ncbi:hypothetical protein GCM10011348_40110 [Marinobacterium nitratireducens]|uniref:Uncharacterized protein n=1 Tax=Marinobacterium nitratireducens TaxID=518897 RepID=A0A917ZQD1_9GAMM|nr:hypothetical protein [Marinobacterium nitratireducens]GGO87283.1 hypothetical protein GCM10011348_40110 [Marinobacterium nitratireducens]
MFEAHFHTFPEQPAFSDFSPPSLTRRLRSHRHQCPVHAWAAHGKRKDEAGIAQPHWFVYIEYCRHDGAREWVLIERPCSTDLDELFAAAQWRELPRIDPAGTRAWLDKDD